MNRESKIGTGKNVELIKTLLESDDHKAEDLSGHKLFNLDLSKKDFSKSSFKGANLSGSNLSLCDLSSCDLTDANLEGAHLLNCTLDGAKRGKNQILQFASVTIGDKSYYAFCCMSQSGMKVLINEPNVKEYEFKRGKASQMGAILYNFLMNDQKS